MTLGNLRIFKFEKIREIINILLNSICLEIGLINKLKYEESYFFNSFSIFQQCF